MNPRFRLLVFLTLCGLLANLILLYWKLSDPAAGIAGCGAESGCSDVLASRWSQVFMIPLPAFGVLIYIVLCAALFREKPAVAAFCYVAIAGSAVWLIFVQVVFLKSICVWCMAAHGIGCLIAMLGWYRQGKDGVLVGIAASLCLALAQLYGPVPDAHRIEDHQPAARTGAIHAPGNGRMISFDGGAKFYDVSLLPRLGSVDAKHVMVEYFDYQCPACRTMRGYLTALVAKHPAGVCVLMLPVPLEHACNPALAPSDAGHAGSCELARIALAVWRVKPDAFPETHEALMTGSTSAVENARRLLSSRDLEDPWIESTLRAGIADWVAFSGKSKQLPKLLIREKRILHGLPSGEADFILVMEKELALTDNKR